MRRRAKLGWILGAQGFGRGVSFLSYFAMAFFLTPEDLGTVALAWMIVAVGDSLLDLGIMQYWIREGRRDAREESTCFWTGCVLALGWSALSLAAAVIASRVVGGVSLLPYVSALCLLYGTRAAGLLPCSIQVVRQDLRGMAIRDSVAVMAGAAIGIAGAWLGFGAWALIARLVLTGVVASIVAMVMVPWRPVIAFERAWLVRALRFGVPLGAATNLPWLILLQVEGYSIGRVLGTEALGMLQFARRPAEILSQLMNTVRLNWLFREFAALATDREATLRELRWQLLFFAALGAAFSVAVLAFAALVNLAWGDNWSGAVPLLLMLAPAGVPVAVSAVGGALLAARGEMRMLLLIGVASVLLNTLLILISVQFGLRAVSLAWLAGLTATTVLMLVAARRVATTDLQP